MNLLIDIKGYSGTNANTCKPKFGKNLQYVGVSITDETVQEVTIAASATVNLFTVLPADQKKFIYLEASAECDIILNAGAESTTVKPVVIGSTANRGIYLLSADITQVDVTNNGAASIVVYYITAK